VVGNLQGGQPPAALYAPITQPVGQEGRTQLNLTVTILPSELQRIVDGQALAEGWVATVMDSQGRVVARRPAQARYVGRSGSADLLSLLTRQKEGLFHASSLEGRPITGYFSTSPQGWTYVTAMPRAALAPGIPPAVRQLILGALVLLTAAVISALFVARRIVAPVNALREAAEDMRAGRPVIQRPTGIRECDAVSGALAEAARTLNASQWDLQHQVAEAVAQARSAERHLSRGQRAEALGRLTGGVAHDFNNLLGVIGNSAHLMEKHATKPELKVPLAAVMRSVEAGSRLTQHLLRVAGQHPSRPGAVALSRYLLEAQELLRVVLGKRIEIEVKVEASTRAVTVDASELELALINLALNARDALPRGGHVWVEARNADAAESSELPPGDYVALSFSDDGHGIDEDVAQRAFEPFFTTKPVGQGTGLGLSQVQGFASQSGGRARLAGTRGLGTSVTLLLPAAGNAPAAADAATAPPGDAAPDSRLRGRRVLLVEDNEELASVTAVLLGTYGCSVEVAPGSLQALALLEQAGQAQGFDVVLSDVVMPGELDGITLARRLRQEHPQLPVVLISGYNSGLSADAGLRVLRKPCSPAQLVDALADALAAR
jgi:signal transduction histidine kinase